MDELRDTASWAQLDYHEKPGRPLHAMRHYDGLIAFDAHMGATGFVRAAHAAILIAADTPDELLSRMAPFPLPRTFVQMHAELL